MLKKNALSRGRSFCLHLTFVWNLYSADYTAGYFASGISRRLSREVIGVWMYYDGFTDYLIYRKSVRKKNHKRFAGGWKKRRQISCVAWMFSTVRIIVHSRITERIGFVSRTGHTLMYVKTEYIARIIWKTWNINAYNCALVWAVKQYFAVYTLIIRTAFYKTYGIRVFRN